MFRWIAVLAVAARIVVIGAVAMGVGGKAIAEQPAAPVFERDVLPILNAHCLSCHGGLHQQGKLDLRTLKSMQAGGEQGAAIVPGSADKSLLWQRVTSDEMPPKPIKVSAQQKAVLRRWIESGAPMAAAAPPVALTSKKRTAEELAAFIDREIDTRLAEAKVPASPPADDGEFLRRVYLDMHGRIPSREVATAFLTSTESNKRQRLVDSLLGDPRYGEYWAGLWRDRVAVDVITCDKRKMITPAQTKAFHVWLAEALNKNRPWNELVREMITAEGESPPVAFIRQSMEDGQPTAKRLAASMSRRFLGVQLQCAECHDHPFTTWTQADFWGMAAFFSRTAFVDKGKKGIFDTEKGFGSTRYGNKALVRKDGGVVLIPEDAGPRAGQEVAAKFLEGGPVTLSEKFSATETPRHTLAAWVTAPENVIFARATVNRLWAQVFGRGLVEPVDSLDAANLPSHPALLNSLTGELVASGYDVKHMLLGMTLTRAYQRTHRTVEGNESDTSLYSHATIKAIRPEPFYDCLIVASGSDLKSGNMEVSGSGKGTDTLASRGAFLSLFKTDEVDGDPTTYTQALPQALALLNQPLTNEVNKLVGQAVGEKGDDAEIVSRIYVGVLGRFPATDELSMIQEYLARQPNTPARFQAVWWALINSPEFAVIP
jgi:hypothetical protein